MSDIVKLFKGKPMIEKGGGLVSGVVPAITTENVTPSLTWNGSDFPRKLYLQTVAFAKWCMDEYGGEVQGRLYYNENTNKWAVAILPQWMKSGLHSEEIEDHEDRAKALSLVSGAGWLQNGTWHSHAFAAAGQSGTDYKDEIKQPGFHYTVGSLKQATSTYHSRYSYRGVMYDLRDGTILKTPSATVAKCTAFPDKWKKYLHKQKVKNTAIYTTPRRGSNGLWPDFDNKYDDQFGFYGSGHSLPARIHRPQGQPSNPSRTIMFLGVEMSASAFNEYGKNDDLSDKMMKLTLSKKQAVLKLWLATYRAGLHGDFKLTDRGVEIDGVANPIEFDQIMKNNSEVVNTLPDNDDIEPSSLTAHVAAGMQSKEWRVMAVFDQLEMLSGYDDPIEGTQFMLELITEYYEQCQMEPSFDPISSGM